MEGGVGSTVTWTVEEGIGVVLRLREVRMSLAGFLDLPLLLTGGIVGGGMFLFEERWKEAAEDD